MGLLITLVGPAGAGKNRLMQHILTQTRVYQLATATTRAMRSGEAEGREHYFVTKPQFEQLIADDKLLEWQVVHENLYGIVRDPLEDAFTNGAMIMADIEIYGVQQVRAAYPDNVITVFIAPPSIGDLIARMQERGDKTSEIGKRLLRAPIEIAFMPQCEHVICNDDYERSADVLLRIVKGYLETGARPSISDAPPAYHFAYYAEAIPVTGDAFADRVQHAAAPSNRMRAGDLPHEVALEGLRSTLNLDADAAALVAGGERDGEYLPPVGLYYNNAEHEQVIYRYLYRVDVPFALPDGWTWKPIHLLREALSARLALPGSPLNLVEDGS